MLKDQSISSASQGAGPAPSSDDQIDLAQLKADVQSLVAASGPLATLSALITVTVELAFETSCGATIAEVLRQNACLLENNAANRSPRQPDGEGPGRTGIVHEP